MERGGSYEANGEKRHASIREKLSPANQATDATFGTCPAQFATTARSRQALKRAVSGLVDYIPAEEVPDAHAIDVLRWL